MYGLRLCARKDFHLSDENRNKSKKVRRGKPSKICSFHRLYRSSNCRDRFPAWSILWLIPGVETINFHDSPPPVAPAPSSSVTGRSRGFVAWPLAQRVGHGWACFNLE
ncbi:MAG: hypothetical protein ACJAT6_000783 [Akkermansiaceae bacterium]|jgi:hypothetical protein